jgi:hypothetical protein
MRVALHFTSTFGQPLVEGGRIPGADSGRVLLRRLMSYFDQPIVISPYPWHPNQGDPDGFEVRTVDQLPKDCLVISMDPLQAVPLYLQLKRSWRDDPKIVNFAWYHLSDYRDPVARAQIATALAAFPTFANSQRSATQLRELGRALFQPTVEYDISWASLGIDLYRIPTRRLAPGAKPTVAFPAMWANGRKGWEDWSDIVDAARARIDLQPIIRLHPRSPKPDGWEVEGLLSEDAYYEALDEVDVFVATSKEESYGLQYLELLAAGAVGIFPDRPWARAILSDTYPLVYSTVNEAKTMLLAALRHLEDARVAMPPRTWIAENHSSYLFRRAFLTYVDERFGA